MCELLLADYTRRGILEGVGIRLPSIVVRPGKPNKAASGFFSGIIREPLAGQEAVLPVAETVVHTHASPRSAVGFLIHAAGLPRDQIEPHINLTMPGVCCTVGEQIEALRRVAGDKVAARIRREPDALIVRIVAGWPQRFEAKRAPRARLPRREARSTRSSACISTRISAGKFVADHPLHSGRAERVPKSVAPVSAGPKMQWLIGFRVRALGRAPE